MEEHDWLAERFETHGDHLRGVAYRMLGSLSEADDAVQEAWLRLSRTDPSHIENLRAWLTTVVGRVCLDMLRSRKSRREEPLDAPDGPGPAPGRGGDTGPEDEAVMADSVGLALLVVLDTLGPAERLSFVLHDMFGMPFDEIAPVVGRSPAAARQLASRARRRVQGAPAVPETDLSRQRRVVDAFLAATRNGDFEALVAVLDPDVTLRADAGVTPAGVPVVRHGAEVVARGAIAATAQSRFSQPALVDGSVGLVVAPRGRLFRVLGFTIRQGRIAEIDIIADPDRLRDLDLAVLDT